MLLWIPCTTYICACVTVDSVMRSNAAMLLTWLLPHHRWGKPLPAGKSRQRIDKLMTMTDLELKVCQSVGGSDRLRERLGVCGCVQS
jgi:hypothetical protein